MSSKKLPSLFGMRMTVGDLESAVLHVLWQKNKVTVREVLVILKRNLAYTTVMTVMDNLYKKGFLTREKIAKSFYYSPVGAEEKLVDISLTRVIESLIGNCGTMKVLRTMLRVCLPVLPVVTFPTFSPKTLGVYKRPVGYGALLTLGMILLGFSTVDLLANLRFFGTVDYLTFLASDPALFINELHLLGFALVESLPVVNILTALFAFLLVLVLAKKLSKLFNFRTPNLINLRTI